MLLVCAADARAVCHRQRLCVNDVLVLPVVIEIRHIPVIQIDFTPIQPLRRIVVVQKNTEDRNLRKRVHALIQTTETIVADLIWIEFTAVVARSTVVANLISL